MPAIKITQKGEFEKITTYLGRFRMNGIFRILNSGILQKYGNLGVQALASATPKDTGQTAASWSYTVETSGNKVSLSFHNSNVNKGVNIAIILQYGHGTGTGGWVEGRDYINPAIRPLFDQLAEEAWKEVTRV